MPIQFRCGSCNQLLGIATRKAGQVVNCPTCGNKTVVPRMNGIVPKGPQPVVAAAGGEKLTFHEPQAPIFTAEPDEPVGLSLLDRVDVEKLLAAPKAGIPVSEPVPDPETQPAPPANVERVPGPRNLEITAMPNVAGSELLSMPELDALPSSPFTVAFTPVLTAVLITVQIALLAGTLLLGMWLGSRFAD